MIVHIVVNTCKMLWCLGDNSVCASTEEKRFMLFYAF